MSTFRALRAKGLVTRVAEGRSDRYMATISQKELRESLMAYVLDTVFEGDVEAFKAAVAGLKGGKKK